MTDYIYLNQRNKTNPEHKSMENYAYILFCRQSIASILSCD